MNEAIAAELRAAMPSPQRVKRVYGIDIPMRSALGKAALILACLEESVVFAKILAHLDAKASEPEAPRGSEAERRRRAAYSLVVEMQAVRLRLHLPGGRPDGVQALLDDFGAAGVQADAWLVAGGRASR